MKHCIWRHLQLSAHSPGCCLQAPALNLLPAAPAAAACLCAGRWGGAITAALFLQAFVTPGTGWGHLDVAGPAWQDEPGLPTGFGAATLTEWVLAQAQQQQEQQAAA
jgi:leucyl aminopeptidase